MAGHCGDVEAASRQRSVENPFARVDWIGSALLPMFLLWRHLPVLGWVKPLELDLEKLRRPCRDGLLIAAAGPACQPAAGPGRHRPRSGLERGRLADVAACCSRSCSSFAWSTPAWRFSTCCPFRPWPALPRPSFSWTATPCRLSKISSRMASSCFWPGFILIFLILSPMPVGRLVISDSGFLKVRDRLFHAIGPHLAAQQLLVIVAFFLQFIVAADPDQPLVVEAQDAVGSGGWCSGGGR